MNIIGFDVSKNELVGIRTNQSAAIKEKFILANTRPVIEEFLDKVASRYPKLTIASEATAEYHRTLAMECLKRNISFKLLNPIVTKQFTKATVRKKKTDLSDAHIIAKCVLQGEGATITIQSLDPAKLIDRTSSKLGEISGALMRLERRFNRLELLEPAVIKNLSLLKEKAQETVTNLKEIAQKRIDSNLSRLICSVTGIGPNLASTIILELEDIDRFKNPKSLIAYAGLDPRVKQSGISLKRNTHLTKRGSPFLRRAVYIAASVAQRHDPELKEYYQKKRNEGKRYREATIANARHVLNRVYAVWKRGTPYIKYPQKILT